MSPVTSRRAGGMCSLLGCKGGYTETFSGYDQVKDFARKLNEFALLQDSDSLSRGS